ncbi:MAG TPA: D-Ala-D-Ala carboxypeptidase family metallohydrolase [Chroococcidiopsis sp.]
MGILTADQRNYYFLLEAERTGIHKPILAALYAVHNAPNLTDGETGLGIAPANRVSLEQVNTFAEQVQFAANTVRSITNRLAESGWKGSDLWDPDQGRYSDRFVRAVSEGYAPPSSDAGAARLEPSDGKKLLDAYIADLTFDYRADGLPQNLAFLDKDMLVFVERVPTYYAGLPHQRDALLETVRLWRKLDTTAAAIDSLKTPEALKDNVFSDVEQDQALLRFVRNISPNYSGFPHQREALLRLVQFWRQLDSREEAITSLEDSTSAETHIQIVDPALVAFVQRIPQFYKGKGEQRHALTEAFRLWRGLDSRAAALKELGIDPQILMSPNPNQQALLDAATQLDRQLVAFIRRLPNNYSETEQQREALLRLVQIWRGLDMRDKTLQSLFEDLQRMAQAKPGSQDAPPPPEPNPLPPRPARWTVSNIQIHASIIPNGNFTWAEATHGGSRMPPNQPTVDAIIRIATLAQQARDRIGRPFRITSWYRPPDINERAGGASNSRHMVGDAIDFYCDGLTGDQIYRALSPWWTGGLGRYQRYPNLSHIDARGYRARWVH